MELTWTTEKSGKEFAELVRWDPIIGHGEMLWYIGSMIASLGFLYGCECFGNMLVSSPISIRDGLLTFVGIPFAAGFIILIFQVKVIRARKAYRKRKTRLVEYRLTDDTFAVTAADVKFSSLWSEMPKMTYLLEEDILCLNRSIPFFYFYNLFDPFGKKLLGKNLPIEACFIPDWKGHGVEREELVAVLEKAGLKKSRQKLFVRVFLFAVTAYMILSFGLVGIKILSVPRQTFQRKFGGVELNRVFFQIVDEGGKDSDNPYFNYWGKYGNFVQRFAVRRMAPLNFEKYEYFFKDGGNSQGRKVGIAGTVDDQVCYVRIPSGEAVLYSREQWERYKSQQKPEGYYPASARAEWLEKVRPLVPELRKAEQDRLLKGNEPITTR